MVHKSMKTEEFLDKKSIDYRERFKHFLIALDVFKPEYLDEVLDVDSLKQLQQFGSEFGAVLQEYFDIMEESMNDSDDKGCGGNCTCNSDKSGKDVVSQDVIDRILNSDPKNDVKV